LWGSGPKTTASHPAGYGAFFVQCAEVGIKNYGVDTLADLSFLYILNKKKGVTEGNGIFYESGSNVSWVPGNIRAAFSREID